LFAIIHASPIVQAGQQIDIEVVPLSTSGMALEQILLVKELFKPIKNNYVNLGNRNHLWQKLIVLGSPQFHHNIVTRLLVYSLMCCLIHFI
jgi:hypothetical protein